MRINSVIPSRRRGELIGHEVVLCRRKQMPRAWRELNPNPTRTGKLRGHHNHSTRRRPARMNVDPVMDVSALILAPLARLIGLKARQGSR